MTRNWIASIEFMKILSQEELRQLYEALCKRKSEDVATSKQIINRIVLEVPIGDFDDSSFVIKLFCDKAHELISSINAHLAKLVY